MLLHCIFGAVTAATTALLYAFCPDLSLRWIVPVAIGAYLAAAVLYILGLFVISLFPVTAPRYQSRACHAVIRHTLPWLMPLIGVIVRMEVAVPLPDRPFLLVSNHRSNFDPLAVLTALRTRRMSFVSKPENFRLPLAGNWMRRAAFLAIDRENPRKAMTAIHQAADLIAEHGLCMGLYPEGTRNKAKEPLPLLPFHNGSLKIAKLARCPVAVTTVRYEKKGLFRIAHLTVVDVLEEDFVTANRTDAIGERVQAAIERELKKHA